MEVVKSPSDSCDLWEINSNFVFIFAVLAFKLFSSSSASTMHEIDNDLNFSKVSSVQ